MKIISTIFLILCSSTVYADVYECSEHSHSLNIVEVGFEHINHKVYLNNQTLIKELVDHLWFIEEVHCTIQGFLLVVSHVQYNDPDEREFNLRITGINTYQLKISE